MGAQRLRARARSLWFAKTRARDSGDRFMVRGGVFRATDASTPPVAEAPRAASPPPAYARAATPPVAEAPPRAPTPPSYARAATPPIPNRKEECVVCGRSTAADACSPWNVLTCDVPGCGNEVHTYCTLANPIEEFTCPKCVEKKSLTKHPSLDARIAQRREEFKY